MHSGAISEPLRKGAWITDVTYEPAASQLLHSRENAGNGNFGYADVLFGAADRLYGDQGTSILEFSVENSLSMGGGNVVYGTNNSETINVLDGVTLSHDQITATEAMTRSSASPATTISSAAPAPMR